MPARGLRWMGLWEVGPGCWGPSPANKRALRFYSLGHLFFIQIVTQEGWLVARSPGKGEDRGSDCPKLSRAVASRKGSCSPTLKGQGQGPHTCEVPPRPAP